MGRKCAKNVTPVHASAIWLSIHCATVHIYKAFGEPVRGAFDFGRVAAIEHDRTAEEGEHVVAFEGDERMQKGCVFHTVFRWIEHEMIKTATCTSLLYRSSDK